MELPTSNVLETLLAPISVDRFLRDHWDRRALLVEAGAEAREAKLAPLGLSVSALRAIAARAAAGSVWASYNDETGQPVSAAIDGGALDFYFKARQTVFVRNVQAFHLPTRLFVSAIKAEIRYPAKVDAVLFWSPPSTGFGYHFDCKNAFTIQLEGRKRWRYERTPAITAPPVAEFRRAHPWSSLAPLDDADLAESVLEPGDVLYLPAGTWHSVAAEDDAESLSVAIGFAPHPLHQIVTAWIDRNLEKLEHWRRTPLPARRVEPDLREHLASLRSLIDSLTVEQLDALLGTGTQDLLRTGD